MRMTLCNLVGADNWTWVIYKSKCSKSLSHLPCPKFYFINVSLCAQNLCICMCVCTFSTCVQVLCKARKKPRAAMQVIMTWLVWVQETELRSSKKLGSILSCYSFSWQPASLSAEPSSHNIINSFLTIVIVESHSYSCDRFAFSLPVKNELMFLKYWLKQICRRVNGFLHPWHFTFMLN